MIRFLSECSGGGCGGEERKAAESISFTEFKSRNVAQHLPQYFKYIFQWLSSLSLSNWCHRKFTNRSSMEEETESGRGKNWKMWIVRCAADLWCDDVGGRIKNNLIQIGYSCVMRSGIHLLFAGLPLDSCMADDYSMIWVNACVSSNTKSRPTTIEPKIGDVKMPRRTISYSIFLLSFPSHFVVCLMMIGYKRTAKQNGLNFTHKCSASSGAHNNGIRDMCKTDKERNGMKWMHSHVWHFSIRNEFVEQPPELREKWKKQTKAHNKSGKFDGKRLRRRASGIESISGWRVRVLLMNRKMKFWKMHENVKFRAIVFAFFVIYRVPSHQNAGSASTHSHRTPSNGSWKSILWRRQRRQGRWHCTLHRANRGSFCHSNNEIHKHSLWSLKSEVCTVDARHTPSFNREVLRTKSAGKLNFRRDVSVTPVQPQAVKCKSNLLFKLFHFHFHFVCVFGALIYGWGPTPEHVFNECDDDDECLCCCFMYAKLRCAQMI